MSLIDDFTHAIFGVVRIVMYLAPLAAFAAMAFTVGKFGFHTLAGLGQLLASVYITLILFVLLVFGAIARLFDLRVWKIIIRCLQGRAADRLHRHLRARGDDSTRHREALPTWAVPRKWWGSFLPAGFSFNMDGTAIYMRERRRCCSSPTRPTFT